MVGQKFHKVKSWGRIHSHVHNPIQTSELLWVCQSAWLEKKSSRVAVASLNICTFKDLYSCASLLPPYFLSPQYRVILVAKQIIPVYMHHKQKDALRSPHQTEVNDPDFSFHKVCMCVLHEGKIFWPVKGLLWAFLTLAHSHTLLLPKGAVKGHMCQ